MKITSFSYDVSFFWKWKLIFMFLYSKDCWLYLVFLKRPSCRLVQDWIRIPCIVFVIGSGSAARYLWPSGDKTIWTIYCTVQYLQGQTHLDDEAMKRIKNVTDPNSRWPTWNENWTDTYSTVYILHDGTEEKCHWHTRKNDDI